MPNIKTQREPIYKIFTGNPGPCPKCGSALEKSYQSYLVVTSTGSRKGDSFQMGGDFGWFCKNCPVVVLDKAEIIRMLQFTMPGWKVGSEFWVAGIVNLDAIPAEKRRLPMGTADNPIPLVEFLTPKSEHLAPKQKHHKK